MAELCVAFLKGGVILTTYVWDDPPSTQYVTNPVIFISLVGFFGISGL